MVDCTLRGRRVLVVEDEYMLADELAAELTGAGAIVLGPAGTVERALSIVNAELWIDGAILDANLRGTMVFPVADRLVERGVPFIFATGYDTAVFPPRFAQAARYAKPVDLSLVTQAIGRMNNQVSGAGPAKGRPS